MGKIGKVGCEWHKQWKETNKNSGTKQIRTVESYK